LIFVLPLLHGEISMINNEDEHSIPPIWRHEKLIRLKTGCDTTPLCTSTVLCKKGLSDIFGHFVLFMHYDITAKNTTPVKLFRS